MKAKRHFVHPILAATLPTQGSAGYASAACSPSTYAYCTSGYFDCLTRRACG